MGPHRMPAAELDVSPDLVRQLLRAQQRDLAPLPVEMLAHGWDPFLPGQVASRNPAIDLRDAAVSLGGFLGATRE